MTMNMAELRERVTQRYPQVEQIDDSVLCFSRKQDNQPFAVYYFDIDSEYLARILLENREHFGSTDWDIYIHEDGTLDCQHDTRSTSGWTELIDLYSWEYDEETFDLP